TSSTSRRCWSGPTATRPRAGGTAPGRSRSPADRFTRWVIVSSEAGTYPPAMTQSSASGPASGALPLDPEHDPKASYAFDSGYVRSLTDRVLATTGTTVTVHAPSTGQPLAVIPQSSTEDVAEAF